MKALFLSCLAALASACTPKDVRCEGRLEPINMSAPAQGGAASPASADPGRAVP